jgi:hypothetical protein
VINGLQGLGVICPKDLGFIRFIYYKTQGL